MIQLYLRFFILFTLCALSIQASAQEKATLVGNIKDGLTEEPVDFVTVYIRGSNTAVQSSSNGNYKIEIPAQTEVEIVFSRIGYKEASKTLLPIQAGASKRLNVVMAPLESDVEIVVTESRLEEGGMIREEVQELKLLPTTSGNFESVLPAIALGTSSGTGGELSSQYNVRGGNYDENLVYVNDFEIYRPQLIRSGQQEGLTFPNIDLIRDLSFSSGGFEAKYGDKMSSVLDIKYKRPDSLRTSASISALGASAHLEGSFKAGKDNYRKVRYLAGARYKTTKYLLGSLDITGEYTPNFTDIQTYITYDISRDLQIGLMGNYNRSEYQFIPVDRSTGLGLIDFALNLFTVFEGQEVDYFTTYMGGLSLTYLPDRERNPLYLKFLTSTYQSEEDENFDIIGDYLLGQVESSLGSDDFGEVVGVLGTGTQHQFVRNSLESRVSYVQHKGGIEFQSGKKDIGTASNSHFLQWGLKAQNEFIQDDVKEWERLDSAGFSLNYDTTQVLVKNVLKRSNEQRSNRFTAFVQDSYTFRKEGKFETKVTAGIRAAYWDLNKEFNFGPRAQVLWQPLSWKKDYSFKFAAGMYYQPPFYRELRRLDGTLNDNIQSQKSAHFVAGLTRDFFLGKKYPKKFRMIVEAYYKQLWDIVSYEVDNVRIRYSGENDASGYVTGLDFRINGEFVPGAESWINLSLLRARERLDGVQHRVRDIGEPDGRDVADVPRPTDRLMNLSMFFQDYLPKNENFKVHVNLNIGTGLPFGLRGNNDVHRNTYRFSAYHRVDIGFSLALWERAWKKRKPNHPLRFSRASWASLEVYNLMKVQNVASNTWIKTIYNTQYAIPNYLTSRRINLRLRMDF
ncbi:MAG: TonB-dependent receptor [Saprospiraceae bacterium]|nr:TonB-dependent receptor [Saprospiraceae bacterium]